MGLFKPTWMTDKPGGERRALTAVGRMSDESELARVAVEAPLHAVRLAAVRRISDEEMLAAVAKTGRDDEVRLDAVRRIADEKLLASVAARTGKNEVLDVILDQISDQDILVDLVVGHPIGAGYAWEFAVMDRIASVDALKCIRLNARPVAVRDEANRRLATMERAEAEQRVSQACGIEELAALAEDKSTDKTVRDVAREHLREEQRRLREERLAAAERRVAAISDQGELAALAEDEVADELVRKIAAQAVADQAILKRWALEYGSGSFLCMLDRIADPDDMVEIARDAKVASTRAAATDRIEDRRILEAMARNGWGDSATAAKKLGGYICAGCGEALLPDGDAPAPCVCPKCGAEKHDWEHVNGEIVHRDYSSGTSYDCCRRCGKKDHFVSHNTW